MKQAAYLYFCLITLLTSCSTGRQSAGAAAFMMSGVTQNFPDGTMLYLTDVLTNQIVDSAVVIQNKFLLKHDLPITPLNVFLHTKDYEDTRSFWAEKHPMTLKATASGLSEAWITGSITQYEMDIFLKQRDAFSTDEEQIAFTQSFVKTHPANRASAAMLAGYAPDWGKTLVQELFSGLSQENQNSVYGQQIARFIALNKQHETGDQFTDFEMNTADGTSLKLSEHLGSVTLLEFWASWCGPCRKQSPELVKIYRQYKNAGFRIVSVSLDFSKDGWIKAIQQDSLDWSHVSDLQGRNCTACMIYGINTIPDNYLIDANGKIIAKYVWGEQLEEAIKNALKLK